VSKIVDEIIEKIELPESAYEKASERYHSIGKWLGRNGSNLARFDPHIGPQGSFNVGTATRPPQSDDYDLDLYCLLESELSVDNVSQDQLKSMVGDELEAYLKANSVSEPLAEKRRCWRIEYADGVSFHIDILPGIPHASVRRDQILSLMLEAGSIEKDLAENLSDKTMAITDTNDADYLEISGAWPTSNPEGFAIWFRQQMKRSSAYLSERVVALNAASIDEIPVYRWKTPLQKAVQLLKRHRDVMFKTAPDSKPISIIITTLAAQAYGGESDVSSALKNILASMRGYINEIKPLVPNPVNPSEDFADKWYDPGHSEHNLEENFKNWVRQAALDVERILSAGHSSDVADLVSTAFEVKLKARKVPAAPAIVTSRSPDRISRDSASPWLSGLNEPI
tara:strand:+ start:4196 stop:5383 length:1188 start_codon:yes stop_codon:yes gene_type:complete